MSNWRFIQSGACSPEENMAVDEAILIAHSEGKVPPTIRFYGWNPATLSIGYFQKASHEVELERIREKQLGFVRRPTGGRAVLHDQELTYSIVVKEDFPGIPKTVTEAYRVLSEGLLQGFRLLGLQAEMVNLASDDEKQKYTAAAGSAACFDSPSWYELVVEGRKIAGSAQVRQKGVVLQHGSILLDLDIDLLFSLLKFPNDRLRARLQASFSDKAIAVNDLLAAANQQRIHIEDAEKAFKQGFKTGLGIDLNETGLTDYEQALTKDLIERKYGNKEWNLRR
jgi:lipoate-protein ligase A